MSGMQAVVDQPMNLIAAGTLSGTGLAQQVTSTQGEAYLTISLDPGASGPLYVGLLGVTGAGNGAALWPGQPRVARYRDVSSIYVVAPSGAAVAFFVERE